MAKAPIVLEISGRVSEKKECSEQLLDLSLDQNLQNSVNNLFIEFVYLRRVPDFIFEMSNLTLLSFDDNDLSELEDSISDLKKLKFLYLENNSLSKLPNLIGDLSSLKVLNLANNKLKSLPDSIKNLSNLRELYLDGNNEIQSIPTAISKLQKLKKLTLPKTIKNPPKEIGDLQLITPRSKDYTEDYNTYIRYKKSGH